MAEQPQNSDPLWTIHQSAKLLGTSEFSVVSRIQTGDIAFERASWGEIVLSSREIERILGRTLPLAPAADEISILPDSELGIERQNGGLKRNGEPAQFRVPHVAKAFTNSEIQAYRAASSAIAGELNSIVDTRKQLEAVSPDRNTEPRQIGEWQVVSRLLNLGQSEMFLCRGKSPERDFFIVEEFQYDSPYGRATRGIDLLFLGRDDKRLVDDFKAKAERTLEFMASNLVAKAQKVVWEQFPDHNPGQIVRAISERCRRAVSNELSHDEVLAQTPSQNRHNRHDVGRGIHF